MRRCPWLGCRHHLVIDITGGGAVSMPGAMSAPTDDDILERWARAEHHCVLDVVDDQPGERTLQQVAELLDITRERVRQIEARAMDDALLKAGRAASDLIDLDHGTVAARRLAVRTARESKLRRQREFEQRNYEKKKKSSRAM